jgi:hypothetical protein
MNEGKSPQSRFYIQLPNPLINVIECEAEDAVAAAAKVFSRVHRDSVHANRIDGNEPHSHIVLACCLPKPFERSFIVA